MSIATHDPPSTPTVKVPLRRVAFRRSSNRFIAFLERHQITIPTYFIAFILLARLLNAPFALRFLALSYRNPDGSYGKGWWDAAFISFYAITFTALRAAVMRHALTPLAKAAKVKNKREMVRFCEQGWACLYYMLAFGSGIYLAKNSPFWSDYRHFWIGYPHVHLAPFAKTYYLIQFSFWIHQFFVLQIEEPRKDYRELVAHHVATCLLILLSYLLNFTRIGSAVFCTMDFADIFLALAKCLHYIQFEAAANVTFAVLLCCWTYSRLYLYSQLVYSVVVHIPRYISYTFAPAQGHYFSRTAHYIFIVLLTSLLCLNFFWTYLMFRIAFRTLRGRQLRDDRSDDEVEVEPRAVTHATKLSQAPPLRKRDSGHGQMPEKGWQTL
ncbi:uncharacterized protein VTP21DRAFT_4843 [Calcarisporiella thermophila]|uniref:uncharacterized protein n=1 Tax=Calcarisporiella thermophila TaxID=911321 RepID=UPI003741F6B5